MRFDQPCLSRIRDVLSPRLRQQREVPGRSKQSVRRVFPGALLILAALGAPSWVPAAIEAYVPGPEPASRPHVPANEDEQLSRALALLQEQPETTIILLQPLWEDVASPVRSAAGMGLLRAHHALGQDRQVLDIGAVLAGLGQLEYQQRADAHRLRMNSAMRLRDSAAMAALWDEVEFSPPENPMRAAPLEESVLDIPFVHGGLIALVVLLCVRILIALGAGLVSLGLYMDRAEGDANVEREYRRFGLFPRVRYSIWTPSGMLSGSAPAWCARKGLVTIAWRPQHPHWRRPRDLMLEDVLLAASLFLAWPLVVAMRIVAMLRVRRDA